MLFLGPIHDKPCEYYCNPDFLGRFFSFDWAGRRVPLKLLKSKSSVFKRGHTQFVSVGTLPPPQMFTLLRKLFSC